MKQTISIISAVVLIIGVSLGAYFLEDRYAKAADLRNSDIRLTVHVAQDRINFLQQQVWVMEDRCGKDESKMTPDQRTRYREMKYEKARLESILSGMSK